MNSAQELSSLDRVRRAEAEAARNVAKGHDGVKQIVQNARKEAQTIIEEARALGEHEGQEQYRRLILQAQDEIRAIGQDGQERAAQLEKRRETHMDIAVSRIVDMIIVTEEGDR